MDVNLWTFSGSTAVVLIAAFLSWGRGRACVVAAFVTIALVVGVFAFRVWQFGRYAGPPGWERRCEEHLKRQGIALGLRHRVIGREGLSRMEVEHLLKTGDAATYCLLSSNDSLSDTDLEYMYEHGDGEVRYILAWNLRREGLRRAFERRYETAYARERDLHMWALMGLGLGLLALRLYRRHANGYARLPVTMREVPAPSSARDVRTGPARDVPKREGRNSLRPEQEGILPVNTERAETRSHGGG